MIVAVFVDVDDACDATKKPKTSKVTVTEKYHSITDFVILWKYLYFWETPADAL